MQQRLGPSRLWRLGQLQQRIAECNAGGRCGQQKDHCTHRPVAMVASLGSLSLRSSSYPRLAASGRLAEIRFEGLVGLIPPLSYSLPQRTGHLFNCGA